MANNVLNTFVFVENQKLFDRLVLNEKGEVDFNVLIPQPNTLNITGRIGNEVNTFENEKLKEFYETIVKVNISLNNLSLDEFIATVLDGAKKFGVTGLGTNYLVEFSLNAFNLKKYGYVSWRKWALDKWGTKWNTYECDDYTFHTAWNIPTKWLQELGRYTNFIMYFADEDDCGNNYGYVVANNGKVKIVYCDDQKKDDIVHVMLNVCIREYADGDDLVMLLKNMFPEYTEEQIRSYVENIDTYYEEFQDMARNDFNNIVESEVE